MHGLDFLLSNRTQLRVLRILLASDQPLSGRSVQRAAGLSNRVIMNALDHLVELRAIHMERHGRSQLYEINRNHYLVDRALQPAFAAEEQFWQDVGRTIRRIVRPRPIAAVATGPLARDETQYGGRLMLTMLFSTGRNRLRALQTVGALAAQIQDRYALTLEQHMLDLNTMDREEYIPLWDRVEREGILLFGSLP
ncbi:MAG: hypothetical protein HQ523_15525 [Lentisphaerae bacterium]|nr:hypothetical protein [Lentisphaerota bacterium]